MLCGCGDNLRTIMRKPRLFLVLFLVRLHWQPAHDEKASIVLPLPMPEKLNYSGPTI
jgi:hypothetical protein